MNRRPAPSVVPSLESAPTEPSRMLLLLGLSGLVVFTMLTVFLLFGTPFVLALPGVDWWAMLRLTLAQGVTGGLMLFFIARRNLAQLMPIYHTLLLGPRDNPIGPPPPAEAVRAAFRFPERTTYATVGCILLVPLLDALGLVQVTKLGGWSRVSVDLLTMAVGAAGTMPTIVLFRQVIWRWLGRLHPTDVVLAMDERLSHRIAFTVALPVVVVGSSGVVALASHLLALRTRLIPQIEMGGMSTELDLTAAGLALVMLALVGGLSFFAAGRLGEQVARDLRALRERLHKVQSSEGAVREATESGAGESFHEVAHTPAVRKLSGALSELSARFAQMSNKEREGRLAMEQVQKLRTQFLASMSHDLRSPLNSIVGFATLIESGAEGPVSPEQRESIQMITRSARDLLRLVTNILDSARLEAGRLRVRRRWTPAADLLAQAQSEGRRLIGDRPLVIETEPSPAPLPLVYVDQDRIVQAIVGLFSHAIDAMREGTIRVAARMVASGPPGPPFPHLRIDVVDRGQGIRETDQAALFEAFREMQEPSGRRIGGLGLGLSVARELVRVHGGDIWFESEAGRGTTFSVAIPLEPKGAPPMPGKRSTQG